MSFYRKILAKTELPKLTLEHDADKVGLIKVNGKSYTQEDFLKLKNLTVWDTLDLVDSTLTTLPEGLKVDGNLHLENSKIKYLPDNLQVNGTLELYNTDIAKLPKNLKVRGDLNIRGTKIDSLPDDLQVEYMIYISKYKNIHIPEKFKNKISY
jgi:hypothetical protein